MVTMFTSYGRYYIDSVDSSTQSGPSMSREEQIKRLEALKDYKKRTDKSIYKEEEAKRAARNIERLSKLI